MTRINTLLIAFFLLSPLPGFSQTKGPVNRIAPQFALPTLDGKILTSANLKGSVVLLEFFQTGCANCQVAAPRLEILHEKYRDQGFTVVSVSFDKPNAPVAERVQAVKPFVKQFGLTYPVLLGDGSIWMNYIQKPGFNSPLIVFIDRKGWIVGQYEEGPDHKVCDLDFLETQVKKLLSPQR